MVRDAADARLSNRFWTGADLMVEMLSPDQPGRDVVESGAATPALKYSSTGSLILAPPR
jgi:hypothetical protein